MGIVGSSSLDALLTTLPARPEADALLAGFVPPLRFASKRFDGYRPDSNYPSQLVALEHLRSLADDLRERERAPLRRLRAAFGSRPAGAGVYLDGGFGVGKTHLLAAFWNAAPGPKAYLSFDELVYTIGLLGVDRTRQVFGEMRVVAIDEWELDDPGNLKLVLAFLRGAVAAGTQVAVTSNTVPDELGRGRFSQKDFAQEIEELSDAFRVLRIEGEDFRHRHFEPDPGREYFVDAEDLERAAEEAGPRVLLTAFPELLHVLRELHPIRYVALAERMDALFIRDLVPISQLPDALRWVHFIDKMYDDAAVLKASARSPLIDLFPPSFLEGPYAKKFGRCLSRMEEMLGEDAVHPA